MDFMQVVSSRRSHRDFTGEPLARTQVEELLRIATLAPNHKRNQPWRFTVVLQEELPAFWKLLKPHCPEVFAGRDPIDAQKKIEKLETKLPKLGAMVYVTVLADTNPIRERENYAAAACAVQNLLLGATNMGLGSFWSTGEIFASTACQKILGTGSDERFVGSIWLGKATDNPEPPIYDLAPRMRFWHA